MKNPVLEQLKDIHLPQPVHWWPPAPGWWIVGIALLLFVVFLGRYLLAHHRRQYFRSQTQDLLKKNWATYQQQTLSDTEIKPVADREFINNTLALLRRAGKTSNAVPNNQINKHLESIPTPALLEELNQHSAGRLAATIALKDINERLYREDAKALSSEQLQCFYEVAGKWLKSTEFSRSTKNKSAKC